MIGMLFASDAEMGLLSEMIYAVATAISPRGDVRMKRMVVVVLLMGVALFVGCGGSSSSGGGGNTTPTLVGISVTPAMPSITSGATQQFTATGSYSDGTTRNLTSTANWLSSTGTVATINISGLATAVGPGTTTITASSGGVSGSTTLTVANPLVSIAITPSSPSIAPNATQQFTATGTYADSSTQDLTSTATWQSSNSTIASISSPGGLATGVAPGTVNISATSSGITGSASLTVTNPLQSITVTPANSTVAKFTKPQFTATGTYFDHSSGDITATVTWTSSKTSVATISNAPGLWGLATAVSPGQTTITATLGAISGNTLLTVSSATIVSIDVTPASAPIALGLQQQYTATATLSDQTTQDVTNIVQWTSSDTTKVKITTSGLATAVGITTSPVTITAKDPNSAVSGATTVTVDAGNLVSISLTPTNVTKLAQGTSQSFSAIGTFNNGGTLDITNQVTWKSSDVTLATVVQRTGLVKAAQTVSQSAPVTITASLQSIQQSLTLTITNAVPTSITVTPVSSTIAVGANQLLHATAVFNDGSSQDVSKDSIWVSSDTTQAIFTAQGRILGLAPTGPLGVTATATFGVPAVSSTANVIVSTATLNSITLTPSQANLAPGSTVNFQTTGNYSDGTTANLAGLVSWASDNPAVATANGAITTGQSPGTANITATDIAFPTVSGTAPVLVTQSQLTTITVTPANPTTYVGVNVSFAATGKTQNQTTINLTSSVVWASASPSVATISNASARQGIATGVGSGTTSISAVFASISGSTNLSVSPATITSLTITPVTPTIAVGSSVKFTATGTFSDGKKVDLSSQATWNSSAPDVAPVSTVGLASGATAGQTTISATFTQPGQSPITVSDSTLLTVQ